MDSFGFLDFWILGLLGSFGLLDFWTVLNVLTFGQFWTFGLLDSFGFLEIFGLLDFRTFGFWDFWTVLDFCILGLLDSFGLLDFWWDQPNCSRWPGGLVKTICEKYSMAPQGNAAALVLIYSNIFKYIVARIFIINTVCFVIS